MTAQKLLTHALGHATFEFRNMDAKAIMKYEKPIIEILAMKKMLLQHLILTKVNSVAGSKNN